MMNRLLTKFNQAVDHPELAKFLLRIGFSGMFLLHGVHKIFAGTAFIQGKFVELDLPGFFAYAAYIGEVVAPILIILGIFTRLSAFIAVGTSLIVILLMHSGDFFTLSRVGAWSVEGIATFLFGFLAIMLLGSGKYALKPNS
ncbi:DoxX subfamily protein [Chelonobacter oris]|uniref:DoxX subfamily protein n=1 Tax=Chelonobacter oris TaxID=505317 RepID=A0A0A3AJA3_9PAST|nr:DoxX family protein [Chelonobacter oris]KGQ69483.1 DoxX subfamily protein [Chelonobacter oris]